MTAKKVTLAKTEYDAMEAELKDLRTIVASRTVVKIVEPHCNWHFSYAAADGTQIKYVLGTDSEADVKDLAAQVEYIQKKLELAEDATLCCKRELRRKTDEINRLNNMKWYDKLFSVRKG